MIQYLNDSMSLGQRRFHWIVKINLMNRSVGLSALLTDAVYKRARSRSHDLLDLAEAERCAQSPRQTNRLLRLSFRKFGDGAQGGMHLVDGKSDRVRELRIQEQKLSDAQRP